MNIKLLFLLISLITINLFAQSITIDLNTAIQLALKNNNDIKIARLTKQQADERVSEAWGSAIFPSINGFVDYKRALKRGEITIETPFFTGSFPQGTENTLSIGASLEQPLFTGAVFLAVRLARLYAEIAEKSVFASESEVAVNVSKAYYSVLLSREVLNLYELTLDLAENNLKDSESLFKAGLISEYDLVRSKVQVKNLIPQLEEAKNSVTLSENLLKLVTGLDMETELVIRDSLFFKKQEFADFDLSKEMLLERNHLLNQLRLQINLQDDAVFYQFTKHFPELYFNANWSSTAQENDPRSFNKWRYKNAVYIGLNLRVPIFDGFQTSSRVQQARIDLLKAEEEYDKYFRLLKNRLKDILLSISETEKKIEAFRSTIEEAQLGYDLSVKRYLNGLGTQLEMVDGLVSLSRAQVNYFSSIYDYKILLAEFDQLLNKQLN